MREILLNKYGESATNEVTKLEIPIDFICEEESDQVAQKEDLKEAAG